MPDQTETDMYSDSPAPAGEAAKPQEGGEKEESSAGQYPLPKEVLQGKDFKVGDEVVLKITAIHDNQIFVEYSQEEDEGKEKGQEGMAPETPPGGETGGGDSEMRSMME